MTPNTLQPYNGYLQGKAKTLNDCYASAGSKTKKNLRKMVPISGDEITLKCEDGPSYVTKKINGEMAVLVFEENECVLINSNDIARAKLPLLNDAATMIKNAGIQKALFLCELHVLIDLVDKVSFVSNALSSNTSSLRLGVFDILEIDGHGVEGDYETKHKKIMSIFDNSHEMIFPIWMKKVQSRAEIVDIFNTACIDGKAEGLVVYSASSIVYKIKPKHSLDCAIIGFTSHDGIHVRDILLALIDTNGKYQLIGRTGNGMSEGVKQELYSQLSQDVCDSKYIETDSRRIAFQFVHPKLVVQISVNDINNENIEGNIKNPLLEYKEGLYVLDSYINGVSLTHAVFETLRDDKNTNCEDVRLSQIENYLLESDEQASKITELSTQLLREVYIKKVKDKAAIQKFMVYQTNKADNKNFLEYFFFYTDFSEGRKEPLKTEVRISNSKEQIMTIFAQYKEENIKKGWEPVLK